MPGRLSMATAMRLRRAQLRRDVEGVLACSRLRGRRPRRRSPTRAPCRTWRRNAAARSRPRVVWAARTRGNTSPCRGSRSPRPRDSRCAEHRRAACPAEPRCSSRRRRHRFPPRCGMPSRDSDRCASPRARADAHSCRTSRANMQRAVFMAFPRSRVARRCGVRRSERHPRPAGTDASRLPTCRASQSAAKRCIEPRIFAGHAWHRRSRPCRRWRVPRRRATSLSVPVVVVSSMSQLCSPFWRKSNSARDLDAVFGAQCADSPRSVPADSPETRAVRLRRTTSSARISVSSDSALMPGSNTPKPPGSQIQRWPGMPVVHVFLPDDPAAHQLARAQPFARGVDARGESRMPGLEQRDGRGARLLRPATRSAAWWPSAASRASRVCRRAAQSAPRRNAPAAACRWRRNADRAPRRAWLSRSGKLGTPSTRGVAAGAGRELEARIRVQRGNVLIARDLADAQQANLQPHLSPYLALQSANRLEEIRGGRELVSLAEIEQRRVFPVRSSSPARGAFRGNPGGLPVHDAHAAGPQRHRTTSFMKCCWPRRRRRITAQQRVFTQQIRQPCRPRRAASRDTKLRRQ